MRCMSAALETKTVPILIAPNPVLKAKARPVGRADDDEIRDLAARMLASMYLAPGIGLAAADHQLVVLLRQLEVVHGEPRHSERDP